MEIEDGWMDAVEWDDGAHVDGDTEARAEQMQN